MERSIFSTTSRLLRHARSIAVMIQTGHVSLGLHEMHHYTSDIHIGVNNHRYSTGDFIPYQTHLFGRPSHRKVFHKPDDFDYQRHQRWAGLPIERQGGFAPYQFQWEYRKRCKEVMIKGYAQQAEQTSRKALAAQHKKPKPVLTKQRIKGVVIAR